MVQLIGEASSEVIATLARSWVGTRYHHQAHKKGVGCDCIGLIIGVWEELFSGRVPKDFVLPAYTPHWGDESGEFNVMAEYCNRYLIPLPLVWRSNGPADQLRAGDVILWRMLRKGATKHAGILTGPNSMVHAYYGHDVMETPLIQKAGSQLTFAFRFPGNWRDDDDNKVAGVGE